MIRRSILSLVFIFYVFVTIAQAAAASSTPVGGTEFAGKLGTAYSSNAEKLGLNLSANYRYILDKYFTAGPEFEIFWLKWDRTVGKEEYGDLDADVKATTDVIIFPVFFNAEIRLPGLLDDLDITPSFTVGLGWAGMFVHNSIPGDKNKTGFYSGYAWQFYGSAEYQPPDSNIAFLADAGYRGIYPSRGSIEFNMSGFVLRAGVKFRL